MDNPSPLPSVFLATSPRMKRSVSSSAGMFRGCAEIIFRVKMTLIFFQKNFPHRPLCSPWHISEYCRKIFKDTPHPSAIGIDHGRRIRQMCHQGQMSVFHPFFKFAHHLVKHFHKFRSAISRERFPALALEASTTSSVRLFRRCAFESRISRYFSASGSLRFSPFSRSM